jgi:hypothetical protein
MNGSQPELDDIAPYLLRERQSYELGQLRAEKIAATLKRVLATDCLVVRLRGERAPGSNCGSCSRFIVYFDVAWKPIDEAQLDRRRYSVEVAVSERGPFVVSQGREWHLAELYSGTRVLRPFPNEEAADRARSLAYKVARAFDLRYLDIEWLRQIKPACLVELPLPADVAQSLDYSDPDALNVLFCEDM